MAASSKPTLSLAKFRDTYYPLSKEDFDLLVELRSPVFKIQVTTLALIRMTLLKGVRLHIVPWGEVFSNLLADFMKSADPISTSRSEGNKVIFRYSTKDRSAFRKLSLAFRHQLGCYCFSFYEESRSSSESEDFEVTKLTVVPNSELNPAYFYGDSGFAEENASVELNLSGYSRLSFSNEPSKFTDGQRALLLSFEDKVHLQTGGSDYQTSLERSFDMNRLDPEELRAAACFLLRLLAKKGG